MTHDHSWFWGPWATDLSRGSLIFIFFTSSTILSRNSSCIDTPLHEQKTYRNMHTWHISSMKSNNYYRSIFIWNDESGPGQILLCWMLQYVSLPMQSAKLMLLHVAILSRKRTSQLSPFPVCLEILMTITICHTPYSYFLTLYNIGCIYTGKECAKYLVMSFIINYKIYMLHNNYYNSFIMHIHSIVGYYRLAWIKCRYIQSHKYDHLKVYSNNVAAAV